MNTPCDVPIYKIDEDENPVTTYECPYMDTYTGYEGEMCRVCCGLGADE